MRIAADEGGSARGEECEQAHHRDHTERRPDVDPPPLLAGEPLGDRGTVAARGATAPCQVALRVEVARLARAVGAPGGPAHEIRARGGGDGHDEPDERRHGAQALSPAAARSTIHSTDAASTRAAGMLASPARTRRIASALSAPVTTTITSRAPSRTG